MPAAKGNCYNPNGRKKGVQNNVTRDVKEMIKKFAEDKFDDVMTSFDALPAHEKVKNYIAILKYVCPTITSINATIGEDETDLIKRFLKEQK